ncbi:uncharacterized protein LOC105168414 [Sesamum indicum]|uniref:Uncharacterized protein LOC105168414 n=1 Tax=Sesamum indicum TaxID=4182 RepID=A0A6I9TLP7_SESIN|nr:uncharacterized protein LOC105168414 [Sesamum indicum]
MGNRISVSLKSSNVFKKTKKPLPIETLFRLPSPLPSWPAGGGFASGIIDLGGLEVCQVSTFAKVWATQEGGPDNHGATFFEPSPLPDGFFMLGCYGQPNNKPLFGWVLAGKDATNDPLGGALKPPTDYSLVWSSESLKIKQDGVAYIWLPTPPDGYKAIGHVITSSPEKPALDKIRCVRLDFTDSNENNTWIWGLGKDVSTNGISIYSSRPRNRGIQAVGVPTGTFVAEKNGTSLDLPCLKNANGNHNSMPNQDQIKALVQAYSPHIYFHPDEEYFPSSVAWFFENGALLYTKGDESNPVPIDPAGSNLPQGGPNDDAYWIDLPIDSAAKERVKKGDLADAYAYLHVKPMFGGTFTDVAIWLFYPFNGPARAKVEFFNISLGKIGEHVGDWEHVTLRISNFNGELKSMYFSQHSKGLWADAVDLEFENGNKPVAYSSLHGHASYPNQGLVLQGNGSIGIRNDSAKGKSFMDTGAKFLVVDAEYLGPVYVEPPWLSYARKWGPKISYSIEDEIRKVEKVLPGKLKSAFEKVVNSLPREVLGEEGPTGPKMKDSWIGDERS